MRLRMSWLDFKLAGRMLSKYPGLTLVGGFSIAFAIAFAAMAFEFLTQLVYPSLPVPGGDRIVALRMWDAAASRPERRALHEFMLWRDELRSVDDIGIWHESGADSRAAIWSPGFFLNFRNLHFSRRTANPGSSEASYHAEQLHGDGGLGRVAT